MRDGNEDHLIACYNRFLADPEKAIAALNDERAREIEKIIFQYRNK